MRLSCFGALLLLTSYSMAQEAAFLGVSAAPLGEEIRALYGIPAELERGVVLTQVHEETAAHAAGFKEGDVLVFFDGKAVSSVEQLVAAISTHRPGDKVSYSLRRGSGTIEGTLKLGGRSREMEAPVAVPEEPGLEGRMERLQKEIDEVRRRAEAKRRVAAPRPAGLRAWMEREERMLEKARAEGDEEKIKFHEIRMGLLREMREGGARAPEHRPRLEERVARLERMIEEILKRLEK